MVGGVYANEQNSYMIRKGFFNSEFNIYGDTNIPTLVVYLRDDYSKFNLTFSAQDSRFFQHGLFGAPPEPDKDVLKPIYSYWLGDFVHLDSVFPNEISTSQQYTGLIEGHEIYLGPKFYQAYNRNLDEWRLLLRLNFINQTGDKQLVGYLSLFVALDENFVVYYNESGFNLQIITLENELSPQVQALLNGNILSRLTNLENQTSILNNHEQRIKELENKTSQNNTQFNSPYFKYLSPTDRKNIICGYSQDNNLTHYRDLGWDCNTEYRYSRLGKLSVKCKCVKV